MTQQTELLELAAPQYASGRKHIPALDGVRGIAILLILICHFSGDLESHEYGRLLPALIGMTRTGVDLFFVLSGFLITSILYETRGKPKYFLNFYARRTLRIFPLYYAVLVIMLLIIPRVSHLFDSAEMGPQAPLWLYYSNMQMAYDGTWTYFDLGLTHFWSLAIEEQFYLVWPLVVFLLPEGSIRRVCIILCAWTALTRYVLLSYGIPTLSIFLLTNCRIDALLIGAFLAALHRENDGLQRRRKIIFAISWLSFAVLLAMIAFQGKGPVLSHTMRYSLFGLTFMGVVSAAATAPAGSALNRFFSLPALRSLGKYSYGIYVFHHVLLMPFNNWFGPAVLVKYVHGRFLAIVLFFLLASTASYLIALVSWHIYEKHWLNLKRYFV